MVEALRKWAGWAKTAVWTFFDHDGFAYASHIALSILLAIFPFLLVLTALAGFIGTSDLANRATALMFDIWPDEVAAPLLREIRSVLGNARGDLLTIGSALSIFFASNGVEALRTALNRAYGRDDRRAVWRTRLQSLGFAILGAIAALLLTGAMILGPLAFEVAVGYVPPLERFRFLLTVFRYAVSFIALVIVLAAVHLWLPAGRRRVVDVLPGIVVTIVASLIGGAAFGEYLARFASGYASTYAGLASPIIALVYLNYSAIIFIYGGELNSAIIKARRTRSDTPTLSQSSPERTSAS